MLNALIYLKELNFVIGCSMKRSWNWIHHRRRVRTSCSYKSDCWFSKTLLGSQSTTKTWVIGWATNPEFQLQRRPTMASYRQFHRTNYSSHRPATGTSKLNWSMLSLSFSLCLSHSLVLSVPVFWGVRWFLPWNLAGVDVVTEMNTPTISGDFVQLRHRTSDTYDNR
jgi:hypothetical protein